jgi:hypothetical protein
MLNFRFKNPYRSDEPQLSDVEEEDFNQEIQEENNSEKNKNFIFLCTNNYINGGINNNNNLIIPEFDFRKILGPKVKIWSRELETNDIERYFNEEILPNVKNLSGLYTAFFLFEAAINSLIKRRDTLINKKTSNKENTIFGLEKSSNNLSNNNNIYLNKNKNCENIFDNENVNINNNNKSNINNYVNKLSEYNEKNNIGNSNPYSYSYSYSSKIKGIN